MNCIYPKTESKKKDAKNYPYKFFNNVDIYIVRIAKHKNDKNYSYKSKISKPCKHCIAFLQSIGIKNVYYTINTDTGFKWKCELSSEIKTDHISIANRR